MRRKKLTNMLLNGKIAKEAQLIQTMKMNRREDGNGLLLSHYNNH